VIVERPRIPAFKCRKGRLQALEDLPAHEGMRRLHALHGDRKDFNENLTPLRRYLERQVGRPWNVSGGENPRINGASSFHL
jgi:hypothetical protein